MNRLEAQQRLFVKGMAGLLMDLCMLLPMVNGIQKPQDGIDSDDWTDTL